MAELKRLNLSKFAERVHSDNPPVTRNVNAYADEDLRQAVSVIGNNLCQGRFVIDDNNRFVYENIRRWCDGNPDFYALDPMTGRQIRGSLDKGLYIAGGAGTGKTVCTQIFAKYAQVLGLTFFRSGIETKLAWKSFYASQICERYLQTGSAELFVCEPSLCLQDIGSEPEEVIYMGNKRNVIGYLLQMRGERRDYITVITSNDRISENIYGDRVTSRLRQMCNYYELKGKDRRK